ncbi:hypothetical protein ASPFODRAFT_53038, partial [Aspergillus luchuensis CBS 106.47]
MLTPFSDVGEIPENRSFQNLPNSLKASNHGESAAASTYLSFYHNFASSLPKETRRTRGKPVDM